MLAECTLDHLRCMYFPHHRESLHFLPLTQFVRFTLFSCLFVFILQQIDCYLSPFCLFLSSSLSLSVSVCLCVSSVWFDMVNFPRGLALCRRISLVCLITHSLWSNGNMCAYEYNLISSLTVCLSHSPSQQALSVRFMHLWRLSLVDWQPLAQGCANFTGPGTLQEADFFSRTPQNHNKNVTI